MNPFSPPPINVEIPSATKGLVLIVDDVPDNLALLHHALDQAGHTVLVATDGETAIARAHNSLPEVILMDVLMPGMDGMAVARKLKAEARTKAIPIVFMTGLTDTEHVLAAFTAGGVDYVTKPLRPAEVVARIASHIQNARQLKQANDTLIAFGKAVMVVRPLDGAVLLQTPLARQWIQDYFWASSTPIPNSHSTSGEYGAVPPSIASWLQEQIPQGNPTNQINATTATSMVIPHAKKRLHITCSPYRDTNEVLLTLTQEDEGEAIALLQKAFGLTQREAEVLCWVTQGKANKDIGEILGNSARTINKHLENIYRKMQVDNRTSATHLALTQLNRG
jgi:DNA-binding NarL/FixJ family response regulator